MVEHALYRELVVGALLAMWFFFSVWVQWRGPKPFRLLRVDLSWYVTRYSFLAPDPHFVRGLVRLRPLTGDQTGTGEPVWQFASRTLAGALWNPRRLPDYTFRRSCLRAVQLCDLAEQGEPVERSPPFRRIINVARHASRGRVNGRIVCELREVPADPMAFGAAERVVHSTVLRGE